MMIRSEQVRAIQLKHWLSAKGRETLIEEAISGIIMTEDDTVQRFTVI